MHAPHPEITFLSSNIFVSGFNQPTVSWRLLLLLYAMVDCRAKNPHSCFDPRPSFFNLPSQMRCCY